MYSLLFIVAVVVALVLERQGKRHDIEEGMEYERHRIRMPEPKPRIPKLESVLNIVLGLLISAGSGAAIVSELAALRAFAGQPEHIPSLGQSIEFFAAGMATGLALIILGSISLRRNIVYQRNLKKRTS